MASTPGPVGLYTGISAPSMSPVTAVLFLGLVRAGRLGILPVFVLVRCLLADG